jgi:hypothetical protein
MWITIEGLAMGTFRSRQQQSVHAYDLIPPEAQQRERPVRRFEPRQDVVDAEFVTVTPTGSANLFARTVNDNYRNRQTTVRGNGILHDCENAAHSVEAWLQRASRRVFAALIVALSVLVFGLSGGFSGLSPTAVTAPPIAAAPLQFTHVSLTPRDANGMRVLLVNGIIDNISAAKLEVPRIRAELVADGRVVNSVTVAPPASHIQGGESRGFTIRMPHSGEKLPELRLSFASTGVSAS